MKLIAREQNAVVALLTLAEIEEAAAKAETVWRNPAFVIDPSPNGGFRVYRRGQENGNMLGSGSTAKLAAQDAQFGLNAIQMRKALRAKGFTNTAMPHELA